MVADILSRIAGGALLATAGWGVGEYITDIWGPGGYVFWVFGLSALGAIIGLTATPYVSVRLYRSLAEQTRAVPTSRLLSGMVGLVVGLLVALLLSIPLWQIPGLLGVALPIALSMLLGYLGAMLMFSPSRDLFREVLPDSGARDAQPAQPSESAQSALMLLDTSAIIDGRIASVSKTGFLQGTLIIPRFVLNELLQVADSSNSMRRTRGRRGLEILNQIREEGNVQTEVLEIDYPGARDVDSKLIGLAKQMDASIVTTDFNLNRLAQIDNIPVLNVNELAGSLRPVVIPGETMKLRIIQLGREPGQGIGFLDDGTMVVVESGGQYMNQELDVTVTRILQTPTGLIIFSHPS